MLAWSSALYATSGGLEVPHAMVGVHVAWNVMIFSAMDMGLPDRQQRWQDC